MQLKTFEPAFQTGWGCDTAGSSTTLTLLTLCQPSVSHNSSNTLRQSINNINNSSNRCVSLLGSCPLCLPPQVKNKAQQQSYRQPAFEFNSSLLVWLVGEHVFFAHAPQGRSHCQGLSWKSSADTIQQVKRFNQHVSYIFCSG